MQSAPPLPISAANRHDMSLSSELTEEVQKIFRETWVETKTEEVPEPKDVLLGNQAKLIESATVLYADMDGSTDMVKTKKWEFSSEVYKAFLRCTARLIRDEEAASITAYDG